MADLLLTFRGKVWLYDGPAAWHFVTVTKTVARQIERSVYVDRSPFGSVRVRAGVGRSSWETSVFPDAKSGAFVLPIKADVRRREGIAPGDTIRVSLTLRRPGR